MKKIIFVNIGYEKEVGGLPIIDRRNFEALITSGMEVFKISADINRRQSRLRRINLFLGSLVTGEGKLPVVKEVCQIIKGTPENYIVYFSHSMFGLEIMQLSRIYPSLRMVSFFHNVETDLAWRELKTKVTLKTIKKLFSIPIVESLSAKKSCLNIVLNKRDEHLLKKYYNVENSFIFPTSLTDRFKNEKKRFRDDNSALRLIFVGTYFFGNVSGIKWFIKKVLPRLENVKCTIIGKGMRQIAEDSEIPSNMELVDYVPDVTLEEYYHLADVAILPIFNGGGMKTKTAEAMMYHLPVISTKEAFCGYEILGREIGLISDVADEWVMFINGLSHNNKRIIELGESARLLFTQQYESLSVSDKLIKKIQSL